MSRRRVALGFALVLACSLPLRTVVAQLPTTLSERASVSLVTVTPGDAVYSLYGHSAIRVTDPDSGLDVVFNYGTFDFDAPWFVPKFVYGILDYQLSISSMRNALLGAGYENRGVVEQVLDLHAGEAQALYAFLVDNARPENRTYRYDFFFDNCATRILDALELRTGSEVTWRADPAAGRSFRELLAPYTAAHSWLRSGIDLIIGIGTDRPASPRESSFLPDHLYTLVESAEIGAGEDRRPLVRSTATLLPDPDPATPGTDRSAAILFWVLAAAGLAWTALRSFRTGLPALTRIDLALWSLLGVIGLLVTFLAFASQHAAMADNWNLTWAIPLHVVVVAVHRRLPVRAIAVYFGLTALLALLSLTGPWLLPQPLPEAAIPVIVFAAIRAGRTAWLAGRAGWPAAARY